MDYLLSKGIRKMPKIPDKNNFYFDKIFRKKFSNIKLTNALS